MRCRCQKRREAFSLVELFWLSLVVCVLVMMVMPTGPRSAAKPNRIKCINNLKNVGVSFRIFADDTEKLFPSGYILSNSNSLPRQNFEYFRWLSNEVSTPRVLLCPADTKRKEAPTFGSMSNLNISYFASLLPDQTLPQAFLAGDRNILLNSNQIPSGPFNLATNMSISWSREMHVFQGNVAMVDGSAQQFSSSRLREGLTNQCIAKNMLLFP
jgi:hypothetical protein